MTDRILTAREIFDRAFGPGREPRSDAYRAGVLYVLQIRIDGRPHAECPYRKGTPERDAFMAGVVEGRALSPVGEPL